MLARCVHSIQSMKENKPMKPSEILEAYRTALDDLHAEYREDLSIAYDAMGCDVSIRDLDEMLEREARS